MIPREAFINKLRDLGYSYKSRQKRTDLYRKQGGTEIVFVTFKKMLAEGYVRSVLQQVGCEDADIETFVMTYKR